MKYNYEEVFKSAYKYFNDEIATNVWINKYAMRDEEGNLVEKEPNEMFMRVAIKMAEIESHYNKLTLTDELYNELSEFGKKYYTGKLDETKIFNLFKDFARIIPQGSVLSQLGNTYSYGSLSNCTVIDSPYDSYSGIGNADTQLANLMKRRCGVGFDISTIRPESAKVSNAANTSTGAVSFMHRFSNTTLEVSQNGRRGALMISMDIRHPSIQKFATIKNDSKSVTGANISIRLSDEFMEAVENDTDYIQVWPIETDLSKYDTSTLPYNTIIKKDNVYLKRVKAKSLWGIIVESARNRAEPGLLFWDRQHKYSTSSVYEEFKNISTNPCVVGDTVVLTTNGLKKIKNLKPYVDKIITQDKYNKFYTSDLEWVGITEKDDEIYEIEFSNGVKQRVNSKHKFYLSSDFSEIMVADLKQGTFVKGFKQDVQVVGITKLMFKEDVWDLTANPNYNFFALYGMDELLFSVGIDNKNDIIVHKHVQPIINSLILNVDCAEIAMGKNDSCRLIATNMFTHVDNPFTEHATFNKDKWYETVYYALVLNDNLVDLEVKSINNILNKLYNDPEPYDIKKPEIEMWKAFKDVGLKGRRTGVGLTGLGDTIAAMGLKYDSDDALSLVDDIMRIKLEAEFNASIDLAIIRGPFTGFSMDVEDTSDFVKMLKTEFNDIYNRMAKHGRRNISISTVAPTGTISLLANNITSGIEPLFMPFYTRRKKINPDDINARVDFKDELGNSWQEFNICHPNFKKWVSVYDSSIDIDSLNEKQLTELFNKSPYYGATAHDINWRKRIEVQKTIQKYVTHSLSVTVNLPNTVTVDEVSNIYMEAWKNGLKGITVYRDGARDGVLVSGKDTSESALNEFFDGNSINLRNHNRIIKIQAPKRPDKLACEIHNITAKGQRWTVAVGMLDNEPYEVWAYLNGGNDVKDKNGIIYKYKKGCYSLLNSQGDIIVKNLNDLMVDEEENLTRQISLSLRTGADIKYVVHSLNKSKGAIISFAKAISRILSKYVKLTESDIAKLDKMCPNCNDPKGLIYENGCFSCKSCGYSKCS